MIKFDFKNKYPILMNGEYEDDYSYGIIYNLYLPNHKTIESFTIYMYIRYGIEFRQIENDGLNSMIFDEKYIYVNFDDKKGNVDNIFLTINNTETFEKFLYMFKDKFYILKPSNNPVKYYNKDKSDWYAGIEIETCMSKDKDIPEYRNSLLKMLENKYSDIIFTQTECYRNEMIELNTYPMPIDDMYKIVFVLDDMKKYGITTDWSCNIQPHINKEYFGNNIEECKNKINKMLIFMYNVDDFIKNNFFNKYMKKFYLCPTVYDFLRDDRYIGYKGEIQFDNFIDLLYNNTDKMRTTLAPYFLNFPRLLNDYEHEPTLEFRLSGYEDMTHERIWLIIAFTEYCACKVSNMNIEDVKKLTIDDFNRFYKDKLIKLKKLKNFDI